MTASSRRRSTYNLADLVALGHNPSTEGGPQLPLPPLLMFDTITTITDEGGAYHKGRVVASLKIADNLALDWMFGSYSRDQPAMPGTFGLEALWQLTGFFLGWSGGSGRARALGVNRARFTRMAFPMVRQVDYVVDIKRIMLRRMKLGVADGRVMARGQTIYMACDLRVGLF
jgi:3-hydroxyacyl-[acyl-carrier protein] dehydratase / trans-2-decenoyl-[acyl-carrier protein] isomerase